MAKFEIFKTQLTNEEFSNFIISQSGDIIKEYEEKLASFDGVVTIIIDYPHVLDPDYKGFVSSSDDCKNLLALLLSFGGALRKIAIRYNL